MSSNNDNPPIDKIPRTTNSIRYKPLHNIINNTYQLSTVQKERVLLAFKEAVIKGFTWDAVPAFIEAKTKLKVTQNFIETLKRLEYLDNKQWYYNLAKDNFAYIGLYRRCVDELELVRQECWHLVLHPQTERPVKVQALREIHNVIKTQVLLVRDLPFIMNLSKYYDPKLLDPDNNSLRKLGNNQPQLPNTEGKYIYPNKVQNPMDSFLHKAVYGAVNKDQSANLAARTLDDLEGKPHLKDVDENIIKEMQNQFNAKLSDEAKAAIEAEAENNQVKADRALTNLVGEIEGTLRNEFKTSGGKLDVDNVKRLIDKSQSSLSYLDSLIGEDEAASVKRLREITDKGNKDGQG